MSAVRDSQHAVSFVYTNLYEHYKSMNNARGVILKAKTAPTPATVSVMDSQQQKDLGEWVQKSKDHCRQEMAKTLRELREARKRFNYLLTEVSDLINRDEE